MPAIALQGDKQPVMASVTGRATCTILSEDNVSTERFASFLTQDNVNVAGVKLSQNKIWPGTIYHRTKREKFNFSHFFIASY